MENSLTRLKVVGVHQTPSPSRGAPTHRRRPTHVVHLRPTQSYHIHSVLSSNLRPFLIDFRCSSHPAKRNGRIRMAAKNFRISCMHISYLISSRSQAARLEKKSRLAFDIPTDWRIIVCRSNRAGRAKKASLQ